MQSSPQFIDLWKQDAEDLGLPLNVQKGLMFLIAIGNRINPNIQTLEQQMEIAHKICNKIPADAYHLSKIITKVTHNMVRGKLVSDNGMISITKNRREKH